MKRHLVLVCVVVLALLATATTASAQVIRIPFTSHVVDVAIVDGGTTFLAGKTAHLRGMVEGLTIESDNPYFDDGYRTVIVNANMDADGLGPAWGTYHMEVAAYPDGYWEGTFWGAFTETGPVLRMVGKGYGELAGMRIEGTAVADAEGNLGTEGMLIVLHSQ